MLNRKGRIQLPKLASALVPAGADFHADYFIPDFFQDYASARNVLGGLRPYERHERTLQLYVENGGVIDPGTIKFKVNAHPPSSILFFLPFGLLPYGLSYLAWNLISAACLGGPDPTFVRVIFNDLDNNLPGDVVYDGTGSHNTFFANGASPTNVPPLACGPEAA